MNRQDFLRTGVLALGLLHLPRISWAQAKIGNTTYPNEVTVGGQILRLNGYGMRFRFGFKGYAGALYAPTKLSTNAQVINPMVTKRFHLIAQRDFDSEQLGRLITRGMQDNISKEDMSKSINGIRMGQMFADARGVNKGDSMVVDYIPGIGLTVAVRGNQLGKPITEPEFSANFFKVWFGEKPIDDAFRKALLGEESSANTNVY